jgi:hypothetical protein
VYCVISRGWSLGSTLSRCITNSIVHAAKVDGDCNMNTHKSALMYFFGPIDVSIYRSPVKYYGVATEDKCKN